MKKIIIFLLIVIPYLAIGQDYYLYELPEYTDVENDDDDIMYIDDGGIDKHLQMPTLLGVIKDTADQVRSELADTAAALRAEIGGGGSGWSKSGNKIYPTNDDDSIGVGTSTPLSKFHVNGSSLFSNDMFINTGRRFYLTQDSTAYLVESGGTMYFHDISSAYSRSLASLASVGGAGSLITSSGGNLNVGGYANQTTTLFLTTYPLYIFGNSKNSTTIINDNSFYMTYDDFEIGNDSINFEYDFATNTFQITDSRNISNGLVYNANYANWNVENAIVDVQNIRKIINDTIHFGSADGAKMIGNTTQFLLQVPDINSPIFIERDGGTPNPIMYIPGFLRLNPVVNFSGLPTPSKGMISTTTDHDSLYWYNGSAWEALNKSGGGGGDVSISGTPAANQFAYWTDASTITGSPNFTVSSNNFVATNDIYADEFYINSTSTHLTSIGLSIASGGSYCNTVLASGDGFFEINPSLGGSSNRNIYFRSGGGTTNNFEFNDPVIATNTRMLSINKSGSYNSDLLRLNDASTGNGKLITGIINSSEVFKADPLLIDHEAYKFGTSSYLDDSIHTVFINYTDTLVKIDSLNTTIYNYIHAHDSLYLDYLSCVTQPGIPWIDSISGALTVDSVVDAGFGLTMEIPKTATEFMKDVHNNEWAYYYENNGKIQKVYTLKGTSPGKTIQKLASRIEFDTRWISELEKQNKELIKRVEILEEKLKHGYKTRERKTYWYDNKEDKIKRVGRDE